MADLLLIQQTADGHVGVAYQRKGQTSPEIAGQPAAFNPPLDATGREDLRWYLEDYLRAPFAVWGEQGEKIAGRLTEWGEALFTQLFGDGKARDAYVRAREAGAKMVVKSDDPAFLALPWELLKDPDRPTPLALDLDGLDRSLGGVEGAARDAPGGEHLRVLMVIARPEGLQDVDYQMIARPLLEQLQAVGGQVRLDVLRPPTFAALRDKLRSANDDGAPYHVLHFDGHGTFARTGGPPDPATMYRDPSAEGYLVFEDAHGNKDVVSGESFAQTAEMGAVPLVVMNACQSGTVKDAADAAVATRLLHEGAAGVVAMAYSVYAVAAAKFMAAFYDALFRGEPASRAVTAGRAWMRAHDERPSPKGPLPLQDWIVPVLYQRRELAFPGLRQDEPEVSLDALSASTGAHATPAAPEGHDVAPEGDLAPAFGTFIGRGGAFYELERAARLQKAVVIHGTAGTGKTELAKAFARWWRDTDGVASDGHIFFHSFEPGIATFGLDGVVNAIGARVFGADFFGKTRDAAHRQDVVTKLLQARRFLLVWDNFETVHAMPSPGQATPTLDERERNRIVAFLNAIQQPESRSAVLITSRTPEAWLGGIRRVELGGLPPQEAAEYADRLLAPYPRAQQQRRDPAYGELLGWLGGHPLSMRLILPQLDTTSPRALLDGLKGQGALPPGFDGDGGRTDSLGASVKYSLDHLPDHVRRILPALSLFEDAVFDPLLATFSALDAVPARFTRVSQDQWRAALDTTARLGLLRPLGGGMYALHPALPAYLAAQWRADAGDAAEPERTAALDALLTAGAAVGEWLNQQIEAGDAGTAFALLAWQQRTLGRLLDHALTTRSYALAQAVLQPLNAFWDARGHTAEAAAWHDRVRHALEGPAGDIPAFDTWAGALWLFVAGEQADAARSAGDLNTAETTYDAIRQQLEAAPETDARQDRLAVTYHQLGIVAQNRGAVDVADRWYRESLAIRENLGDRTGMAKSYHQLGTVAQKRGALGDAEGWYGQALEILEALGDRPGMASSYHQLGMVAQMNDNLGDAEAWHLKALDIMEALGDRPGMANSYGELGTIAYRHGNVEVAETQYRKTLKIFDALGDRPGLAMAYGQLGLLANERGDPHTGLTWTVQSVALFDAFPHPHTGPAPEFLAEFTHHLGWDALAAAWSAATGQPLPNHVRDWISARIAEMDTEDTATDADSST